ncbi:hypothetical protein HPB48_021625 [Haemaphysalis longicornis]|uniref:Uncharacterized protein n=1 Tax=Haemaphysalis longicornis TaxID=44386 RepID=A0A9J6FAD3_HAELO|nr:hypothetical protein HPB48_021625 [Haemaphysalis longicornis]
MSDIPPLYTLLRDLRGAWVPPVTYAQILMCAALPVSERDPSDSHQCIPNCTLCGLEHPMASKECRKKPRPPSPPHDCVNDLKNSNPAPVSPNRNPPPSNTVAAASPPPPAPLAKP